MAGETWPASLPQELLQRGYSQREGDNVLRSQTDVGPPKRRRRFTAAIGKLSGQLMLNHADLATLLNFYKNDLKDGSLSFLFPDPLRPSSGQRMNDMITVSFAGVPSRSSIGALFLVSLRFDVEPS